MSKTKILFISVRADHGGGPKHIDQLIHILHEDYDIFMACPQDEPYFSQWAALLGNNRITNIPHRRFSLGAFLKIRKLLEKENITLVHSHGKGAGIYSRPLKLVNRNLKVIHTFHGIHIYDYNAIQKLLYIFIEKALGKLTHKFINVSKSEKRSCLDLGIIKDRDSTIIYNGSSDLGLLMNGLAKPGDLNTFMVASVSRFDVSKNMQLAYQIAKAFKDCEEVAFIWIGDGPDRKELQALSVQEGLNIIFTGFQENVAAILGSAALYLSTSRWEGLPIALMEASALGLPLIATDVTGNNEVVQHQVNGFLFPSNQPELAVKAIDQLYRDKNLYAQISQQARKIFSEKFHIQNMARDYRAFYASLGQ
ncbi:MAG: glycosyltransferase [Adhaeribacter sp.]